MKTILFMQTEGEVLIKLPWIVFVLFRYYIKRENKIHINVNAPRRVANGRTLDMIVCDETLHKEAIKISKR